MLPIGNFNKMNDIMLVGIVSFCLGLLLMLCPLGVNANEIDSSPIESHPTRENVQVPRQMSEKQMNDLFGEDPYLGQTPYLQFPEGFSQSEKSQ